MAENTTKNTGTPRLTERQRVALMALVAGGKHSAARIGRQISPKARATHGAGSSVLRSLEALGLASRSLSNTWSTGTYLWSATAKGRIAALPPRRRRMAESTAARNLQERLREYAARDWVQRDPYVVALLNEAADALDEAKENQHDDWEAYERAALSDR